MKSGQFEFYHESFLVWSDVGEGGVCNHLNWGRLGAGVTLVKPQPLEGKDGIQKDQLIIFSSHVFQAEWKVLRHVQTECHGR